jgi:hypothetical protein
MVTINANITKKRAALTVELLVAMALLTGALLPIAYSFASERRYARASYQHAVAMEIADGEMEVLAAGEWRAYKPGMREYHPRAVAATNLPPGRFLLTVGVKVVRLEWQPATAPKGRPSIVREVQIQ